MTLQVQEITNFKSGIDLALDPFLSPTDAFVNLRNGFVHRGILQSRKGLLPFADGTDETDRNVSRVQRLITNEAADTGDGGTSYNFTLANGQIARGATPVQINAPTEGLTVTFTYDPTDQTMTVGGNSGGGTNNINWHTGEINVDFSGAIGGGNTIQVTYEYHPDLAIMGISEYVQTPSPRDFIVCDEDFAYLYNGANNDFDQIAFAGGVGPFTGGTANFFTFQNWRLHSRGAVPAAAGALTLSDILFMTNNVDEPFVYDGTDIDLLSNLTEYRQPIEGSLDAALHVLAYGERLIWLRPTLGGQVFGQAVLWGPINDNSGLALDYQGTGSGILSAVTDSMITSFTFIRDTLIVFFETDVYALELTDDAFAPFRWTRLEHERGVTSTHSAVSYFGDAEAVGRLGILTTNGRRTNRADNKIPFFTRDEIDPSLITHIFGTEMEENSQFWWTYPEANSPDLTRANKVLVKNYEENNFAIFDLELSCFGETVQGTGGTVWDNLPDVFGGDDVVDDADPAQPIVDFAGPVANVPWDKWGLDQTVRYKTLAGDHHGFVWALDFATDDGTVMASPKISGADPVPAANPTVIQTEYHNFSVGDRVILSEFSGMTELNGLEATVTAVTDQSSLTLDINSTNFTAWTAGGQIKKPIAFEAEFAPFSAARPQGQRTYLGKMDFLVTSGTGDYTIDFFEDRNSDTWTEPSNSYTFTSAIDERIDRWFSIYVDNTADFHRWRIKQSDEFHQAKIKSLRIWHRPAGDTND